VVDEETSDFVVQDEGAHPVKNPRGNVISCRSGVESACAGNRFANGKDGLGQPFRTGREHGRSPNVNASNSKGDVVIDDSFVQDINIANESAGDIGDGKIERTDFDRRKISSHPNSDAIE